MDPGSSLRFLNDEVPSTPNPQQLEVDGLMAKNHTAATEIARLKEMQDQILASGKNLLDQREFQRMVTELEVRVHKAQASSEFVQFTAELETASQLLKQLEDADSLGKQAQLIKAQQQKRDDVGAQIAKMKALLELEEATLEAQEKLLTEAEVHSHKLAEQAQKAAAAYIKNMTPHT